MARYLLNLLLAALVLVAPIAMAEGTEAMDEDRKVRTEQLRDNRHPAPDESPRERVRREKNMERWKNLPPERREAMRDAARERVKRMHKELDSLIQQAGGDELDPARREQIENRYIEARRELEARLRRQMDETRKEELPKIVKAIKAEFSIE